MAKKNKSKAVLEAENRMLRNSRYTEIVGSVLNNLIRWSGLVLIAMFGYFSIKSLSGETTVADVGINFLGKVEVSKAIAWIMGAGGTGYGLLERGLRKSAIQRFGTRIEGLEKQIDPARSSSKLTERGDTRPEDRL